MRRWFTYRKLLAATALTALVVTVLLVINAPARALEQAQARWAAAALTDYRIVVELSSTFYRCEQDFEVRAGEVGTMYANRCPVSPVMGTGSGMATRYTVTALFERIQTHLQNDAPCGPNGCLCDGVIGLDVEYDPALGYPILIHERLRPETRYFLPEFWIASLQGGPVCPLQGYDSTTVRVISLTPLEPEKPAKPDAGGIESLPRP